MRLLTHRVATTLGFVLFAGLGCETQRLTDAGIDTTDVVVTAVTVSPRNDTVSVGDGLQLNATVTTADGSPAPTVNWTSSNPSVAPVSPAGLVGGLAQGTATVRATADGMSDSALIVVVPATITVTTVEVTPPSANIYVGRTVQLSAVAKDASGAPLPGASMAWASLNTSIAQVNASGLVTGVAVGAVSIVAFTGGKSDTASVTVSQMPVATVSVAPGSATVGVGQTRQLQATTYGADGSVLTNRTITWSSSSPSIATVSAAGVVSGVAAGSATVTAASEGKAGTSAITVTAAPPPPPPPPPGGGLLISAAELAALPMSGAAWSDLKAVADGSLGTPDLTNQDNKHSVQTLAVALVAARTGSAVYREKARLAILSAIGTEQVGAGNSILALGRILGAYILAADLIGLEGTDAAAFRAWIDPLRTRVLGGHSRWDTLKGTCEDSSNNWGAFACASLLAANLYLGDAAGVARSWQVFQGFTGDRAAFTFPDVSSSWRCTGAPWTPINVASNCGDKLGAPPEDAHRAGDYPTLHKTYTQETMQGLAFQAELLQRAGYPAWARLRVLADFATRWSVWNASAVGTHLPWWYNKRLGINAPTQAAGYGRLFGFTDWLYGS